MDPKQPSEKRNPDQQQQFPGGYKPEQNPTDKPQRDQERKQNK